METKRKVLVVDDNFVNRQILTKILTEDYDVLCAENGMIALEILNQFGEEISAVLLDLAMPIMDGYEFLKLQQSDKKLSQVPIIVTTQQESEETEIKSLSLGAHDFLTKPYNPAIIKHRLANTIKLREKSTVINTVEHDALTGVLNKDFFYKLAQEKISQPYTKFDIVCIDIERFKLVNDLFGKEEGDKLLKYLATIIVKELKGNGICARMGADVFVVLIAHRDHYNDAVFEKAIKTFNKYPIDIKLTLKYGIYLVTDPTISVDLMCDRAQIAAESIKGSYGIHYAYYEESFREKMIKEKSITDNMKQALSDGQFQIYYQPKYDILTGKIIGAEALVRWIHPEKGLMAPDEFIPLFEKNGFITELDFYVWEEVCKKLKQWRDANVDTPPVSVNVSRIDIYNKSLTKKLLELINKNDLEPKFLHLEITESAYTENPEQLIEVVSNLKNMGFVIEMDDFGTGYSSLNILSELPIDIIKLDMRFLQNKNSRSGDNIINFIISLAKWMGLTVVAEGVEFAEQVVMLRNMDCNYAQGYFYSKPLPVAFFESLLIHSEVVNVISGGQENLENDEFNLDIAINSSKRTMLIVDDMTVNRKILAGIFKEEYNIIHAENGQVALDKIHDYTGKIDIILMDLLMPVLDGFKTLKKLKTDKKLKSIPVIITSQEGEISETKVIKLGAADFISKPYNKEIAVRRVQNVMASAESGAFSFKTAKEKSIDEMRRIVDVSSAGIMIYKVRYDGKHEIMAYNEHLCKMMGYTFEEYEQYAIEGQNLFNVNSNDLNKVGIEIADAMAKEKNIEMAVRTKNKTGKIKWIKLTSVKVSQDEEGRIYHCIVTELSAQQQELENKKLMLERDELTSLYNLEKFKEIVSDYLQRGKTMQGMMFLIDIKDIRRINDSLGFIEGNNVICRTAKILEKFFRQTDVVARVESSCFAVFVNGSMSKTEMNKRVKKLFKALEFEIGDGKDVALSHCVIGASETPSFGDNYDSLFSDAKKALLEAKRLPQKTSIHMIDKRKVQKNQ